MLYEKLCKRCGKNVCYRSLKVWSYKIGGDVFCGYNCKNAELNDLEKGLILGVKGDTTVYEVGKYSKPEPHVNREQGFRKRCAILKIDKRNGEVIKRFSTHREAALKEGVSEKTISRWINDTAGKKNDQYIWKYEV